MLEEQAAPAEMFEKDVTSAAIFVSSIERSMDSSCVKPIPCATAPKVVLKLLCLSHSQTCFISKTL